MMSLEETVVVPVHGVEKYIIHLHTPLNGETSTITSAENDSDNESTNNSEVNKSTLNLFANQEEITGCNHLQHGKEDFENSSNNDSDGTDEQSLDQEQDYSKFYRHIQTSVCRSLEKLPIIKELDEKEEQEEPVTKEAAEPEDAKKEDKIHDIKSEYITKGALKHYLSNNSLSDFHENFTKFEVQKSFTKNGNCSVSEIQIDTEVTVEFIPYASIQDQQQATEHSVGVEKVTQTQVLGQQLNCELEGNLNLPILGADYKDTNLDNIEVSNLDNIEVPERNPLRNLHPLFISGDGESHELLLKHRKVMKLTKSSPYERIQKCVDLRRYFGGMPSNYECNKHKEENRVPLWMQKYMYEYRLFLRTLQTDEVEKDSLKRLIKPHKENQTKLEEIYIKETKGLRLAKICRLCGQKCERFVSSGQNVVIKLVSVYLPLVIIEGNSFPLGLCDKCDYSLALICSFMLTYLDCCKLGKNEKKCFTCGCEIENLLTVASRTTMGNLAVAFHGIRFDLREFLGNGLKYLCNACRLSFELLESLREHIWLTNKLFKDGDERLYEKEGEVCKNQFTCEIPPGLYSTGKASDATLNDTVDSCSTKSMIDGDNYYRDDFETRKYFLKKRHRHIIVKFFRGFLTSQCTESKVHKSGKRQTEQQKEGIFNVLKRRITLSLQPFCKLFRPESTITLNGQPSEIQITSNNGILPDLSKVLMIEDNCVLPSTCSLDEISKQGPYEQLENCDKNVKNDNDLSLLNFYLGNMDTSLFEYFNSDIILPPYVSEMQFDTKEPQPSTSKTNGMSTMNY